jgi:flagellar biosynthetic protein FlhB
MADESEFDQRTEPATPRRREEAAEQGQFALSTELNTGIIMIVGAGGLAFLATSLGNALLWQTRIDLAGAAAFDFSVERVRHQLGSLFGNGLAVIGLLLGLLFAAAIAVNVAQVGFRVNPGRLSLDWNRVSPLHFNRFLSWSKMVRGLILLLKLLAVALVAWWILRHRGSELAHLGDANLASAVARSWVFVLRMTIGLAATLLVIGIIDYVWQRWQFERSIRMTKQELKEEFKRDEGDPQIKARMRKLQRDNAQRRMFRDVPEATVIVTNPTHLAVALRYEAGKMTAPKVVAKGRGFVAQRIIRLARRYNVPVIERKPLAQALFKTVKIGREIPLGLYLVVAELLAHVYRLKTGTAKG